MFKQLYTKAPRLTVTAFRLHLISLYLREIENHIDDPDFLKHVSSYADEVATYSNRMYAEGWPADDETIEG